MTREQHNILYSICTAMSCDNYQELHLCPREMDYKYFSYWSEVLLGNTRNKFGSPVGGNKIQIKRKTGEEIVSLREVVTFCPKNITEQRVQLIYPVADWDISFVTKIYDLRGSMGLAVVAVAIERTLVLKENRGWNDMPMIDFTDVFEQRALLAHFKSLFQCYMKEIRLRQHGTQVLQRMTKLLSNWEKIYAAREEILNQVEHYVELIMRGIEQKNASSLDLEYNVDEIMGKIRIKKEASDFLSFLLSEEGDREQFRQCVTVLKAYVEVYGKRDSAELQLLCYLQKYEIAGLHIDTIKKLRKIDLGSPKAGIANAEIIERYLADEVKNSGHMLFENVA